MQRLMRGTWTMWLVVHLGTLHLGTLHLGTVHLGTVHLGTLAPWHPGTLDQPPRSIRVNAERFSFTPSKIEIDAGEDVEIHLKSDDTSHGFRILGPGRDEAVIANVAIPKRGKGEIVVPLKIEKPGRYVFECSRMCGAGHNFMRGELVVRERAAGSSGGGVPRPLMEGYDR
ncbi:MAG TPA: cupredoxin domain-containing protein [Vicinamibacterales bacterium]